MAQGSRSRPSRAVCPEEALFVEIQRTADCLARRPAQLLREHDLSPNQYNVLRILRGAPEGLLCGEIATRMITREPDITRLLDRLEKRRLIGRFRQTADRRRILARITGEGLELLAAIDDPLCRIHRRQLAGLGPQRLAELSRLMKACRPYAG
jgi:DNA-binding MarR family transcriptional regulator